MGSGSSARKKAYTQTTSDSGILKRPSDGEIVGHAWSHGKKDSKKKAAAHAAFEQHLMDCKATDLQKVWTIRQAFPLSTSTGKRSATMLPEKLHCANCHCFIVKLDESQETEFFACKNCWEVGIRIGICTACRAGLGPVSGSRPSSARSGVEHRGSKTSLLIPNIKSGTSLEPPRSRSSQRSNRSMSSGSSDDEHAVPVSNYQIFSRVHTNVSRNHLRQNYQMDRRSSDPGSPTERHAHNERRGSAASEMPVGARPSMEGHSRSGSKHVPSRASSRQGSRQQSKESVEDVTVLPSGVWSATIQERTGKKQKNRIEERNLHFNPDGTVEGSGSFEGTVNGFVNRPHIEWTEFYVWGNILVKLKYHRSEPWLLEGHFEASDGGSGKMTLVHEELKAAVEMGT